MRSSDNRLSSSETWTKIQVTESFGCNPGKRGGQIDPMKWVEWQGWGKRKGGHGGGTDWGLGRERKGPRKNQTTKKKKQRPGSFTQERG